VSPPDDEDEVEELLPSGGLRVVALLDALSELHAVHVIVATRATRGARTEAIAAIL
jgi:hypothetical protein